MTTNVWLTPPDIVKAVGPFDLDPAAAPEPRPWPTAKTHYTEAEGDGLSRPWFGFVWLNPPYKPSPEPWIQNLADHGTGISLVFARTDAPWFRRQIWERSAAILFFTAGHLHFHYPNGERASGNSGGASVLVGYGSEAVKRLARADIEGHLVFTTPTFLSVNGKYISTWREVVEVALSGKSLDVSEIYREVERAPKVQEAKAAGHNWRAQIRRSLQRHFRPVRHSVWRDA